MWKPIYSFFLLACEVGIIIAYGRGSSYKPSEDELLQLYPLFQDIHVMIFVGFGFLMVFLKRHSWASVGLNLFVACWAIQIYILYKFMWESIWDRENMKVHINMVSLITADFAAGAVLITFGAVLGKVSAFQLFILAIIEVFFYSLNERILYYSIMVQDIGGSMVIHSFGAFFGLACSLVLTCKKKITEAKHLGDGYINNLVAMVGTIFLFMYWPSFNGALAGNLELRERAIQNTYLSLTASVIGTFMVSPLFNHEKKIRMEDILNATLSGGVVLGSSCDVIANAWVAIVVGFGTGIISCLGFNFITPKLNKYLHDTCGVLNLHGIPGFLGSIASAIIVAGSKNENFPSVYGTGLVNYVRQTNMTSRYDNRTMQQQAGYQILGIAITLGIAIGSGLISGVILKFFQQPSEDNLFNDQYHFEVNPQFFGELPVTHHEAAPKEEKNIPKIASQDKQPQPQLQQQQQQYVPMQQYPPLQVPQQQAQPQVQNQQQLQAQIHPQPQQQGQIKDLDIQIDDENANINIKQQQQTKLMTQNPPKGQVPSGQPSNFNSNQPKGTEMQPLVHQQ